MAEPWPEAVTAHPLPECCVHASFEAHTHHQDEPVLHFPDVHLDLGGDYNSARSAITIQNSGVYDIHASAVVIHPDTKNSPDVSIVNLTIRVNGAHRHRGIGECILEATCVQVRGACVLNRGDEIDICLEHMGFDTVRLHCGSLMCQRLGVPVVTATLAPVEHHHDRGFYPAPERKAEEAEAVAALCVEAHNLQAAEVVGAYILGPAAEPLEAVDLDLAEHTSCTVCLDDFQNETSVLVTACRHVFHFPCLQRWLSKHGTCPVCRYTLQK